LGKLKVIFKKGRKNMIKKVLTILAITTMGLGIGMLIGAIFGFNVLVNPQLQVLITLFVLAVGSGFSINSINLYEKKKIISLISLCLIIISVVLALILVWSNLLLSNSAFLQITMVIALASIFFNIIVSVNVRIYKRYFILQLILYSLIIFIDVTLSMLIFGTNLFLINNFAQIFSVACLVVLALLITLFILEKKQITNETI